MRMIYKENQFVCRQSIGGTEYEMEINEFEYTVAGREFIPFYREEMKEMGRENRSIMTSHKQTRP